MENKYDVLVLGSGIGGLAAALMLSHSGKKVAVFEKHDRPGGRLGSFKKEGYTIDYGVHLVSRGAKSPVIQVLDRCEAEANIEFTSVRPIQSTGGEQFKFPHDLKGRIPDEDFEAVIKFVTDIKGMSDEETHEFDGISLEEFLNRYTKASFAHACVSMVGYIYCCIPEFRLSAGEFCRCLKWEAEARASGYPSGGCVVITNAYIKGIKKYGGEMIPNTDVVKIIVEDGKAVGVVTDNGDEYRADCIVSNAGIKDTVLKLAGEGYFEPEYVQYVKDLEYTDVSVIARFALDEPISPEIKMLSNFSSMDPEEYVDTLMRGEIPEEISTFIVVPSSFDPTIAPEGKQLIVMTTALKYDMNRAYAPAILEKMIDSAEAYFPGLREKATFIDTVLPDEADELFGEDGAGIGIAQQVGQAGKDRPEIKTPLEGLYIVGGEAGGEGVGMELCVNSAIEFYDKYFESL